ncbi:RING finger protein 26 [Sigmodon hispidus]
MWDQVSPLVDQPVPLARRWGNRSEQEDRGQAGTGVPAWLDREPAPSLRRPTQPPVPPCPSRFPDPLPGLTLALPRLTPDSPNMGSLASLRSQLSFCPELRSPIMEDVCVPGGEWGGSGAGLADLGVGSQLPARVLPPGYLGLAFGLHLQRATHAVTLVSHGALRSREILNKGILNMVSNGHALLHQACDICAIAMSLVAYVISSLVNIYVIGTQNLFSLVLALWDAVVGPLWRMTDVLAAFLAHISSSAVAMAILLWTPCQLALELLASAARLLASCVLFHLTGLVLLACVLAVTLIVSHPDLTLRLAT